MFPVMRRRVVVLLVLACLAMAACKRRESGDGRPRVAVSIFPLYDLTRRVAGDRIEVVLVLPPGRSEHAYDPTPKEIARLEGARLGFAVGLDLDGWLESIMRTAGGAKIVRLGEGVETIPIELQSIEMEHDHDHDHDHDHGHATGAPDPHYWLDPQRAGKLVGAIRDELAAIDPAGKAVFDANARELVAALDALDAAIAQRAEAWTKRTIVTFHGSMAYFARRYGLRIAAVVEPIAGKEPTAAYLAEVIGAIKRSGAAALFTEPQLDRGPGEVIAREAGVPLGELDPVGGLAGRTSYEALLQYNADQLDKVLR
jgi:zinc transport system substrate-binding protein